MKVNLFHSCGHCWVLQICWHIECSTFTASSFRIWNSSTGIPSSPLALFIVMLSKAHLTSHSFIIHFNLPFAVFFKPCVILKHAIQFPNIWDFSKGLSVNDIWFNFLVFKEYTLYDLNLLKIFCFMDLSMVYFDKYSLCTWKECVFYYPWVEVFLKKYVSIRSSWLIVLFKSSASVLIFCLWGRSIKISSCNVDLFIFSSIFANFCFVKFQIMWSGGNNFKNFFSTWEYSLLN